MFTGFKSPCDEGVIKAAASVEPCSKQVGRWVLAATIIGSSIVFIDGAVVNVALPVLQQQLNATITDVQWVVEAYALFLAALILVGGALGDHFGRRRIFALGIAIFGAASVYCGLASSVSHLIFARAIQGVGGALLVPGSLAIISAFFPGEQRGRAIGLWSGFTSVTAGLGPALGGWLIGHFSWRWAFFINVPLVIGVLAILLFRVPESKDAREKRNLDWLGAAAATIGLGTVVYALVESNIRGLGDPFILAAMAAGVLILAGFIVIEHFSSHPMMPLQLFRSWTFTGANLLTLMLYAALSAAFFFLPFYLIQIRHYSTTAAGSALIPFILIMFALSRWAGGLINQYGAKLPLIVGPVIASAGLGLFAVSPNESGYWKSVFPAVTVLGLGMVISVAPLTTTVMNSVSVEFSGIASGINNAVSRTAGLLAIAVLSIVILNTYGTNLDRRMAALNLSEETKAMMDQQKIKLAATEIPAVVDPSERSKLIEVRDGSFVSAYRSVMYILMGLALCAAAFALFMIKGNGSEVRKKQSTPEL